MRTKSTIEHAYRKNGGAREAWQKRKREANAARPKQAVSGDLILVNGAVAHEVVIRKRTAEVTEMGE